MTPEPVRLLLDEHYPVRLAAALRRRGHDVVALLELTGAPGDADEDVFVRACAMGRRVVTENIVDFRPLLSRAIEAGVSTAGLLLVVACHVPRTRDREASLVASLDSWLQTAAERPALVEEWL